MVLNKNNTAIERVPCSIFPAREPTATDISPWFWKPANLPTAVSISSVIFSLLVNILVGISIISLLLILKYFTFIVFIRRIIKQFFF